MQHAPWWLLLSVIHVGLLALLWRFRRSDHPWLLRLLGAQWLALLVRGLLAPVGLGGLALLGDGAGDAVAARALMGGAEVLSWATLVLAAEVLARGNLPRWSGWGVGAALVLGAIATASGGGQAWPPAWQTVLVYGVCAAAAVAFAIWRLVVHLADCLRRRITVDLLALAIQLVALRLLVAWVDALQPGPLVHPAFELLVHSVSMVALFSLYGLSKRAAWTRRARE